MTTNPFLPRPFLEVCLHLQHLFLKFWPLFDAIFLRSTGSGSLGPEDPITGLLISRMFWLWIWLETESRLMDVSRRLCTRDQRTPSAFRRSRKECSLLARMFCVRFLTLSLRSFFCFLFCHICFRLFLLQYGSD